jgi:hypothetical protein
MAVMEEALTSPSLRMDGAASELLAKLVQAVRDHGMLVSNLHADDTPSRRSLMAAAERRWQDVD